jgi:hypothetical protein
LGKEQPHLQATRRDVRPRTADRQLTFVVTTRVESEVLGEGARLSSDDYLMLLKLQGAIEELKKDKFEITLSAVAASEFLTGEKTWRPKNYKA